MRADNAILRWQWNEAMPKDTDFTKRIIPLFVIVMIGWVFVISMLRYYLS